MKYKGFKNTMTRKFSDRWEIEGMKKITFTSSQVIYILTVFLVFSSTCFWPSSKYFKTETVFFKYENVDR